MSSGDVVCFHGTRSIDGSDSGTVTDTPVNEYLKALGQMERNTGKVFGSIHGFYGAAARQATLGEGGTFLAVLREPVRRVSSIFAANVGPLRSLASRVGCDPFSVAPESPMTDELYDAVLTRLSELQSKSASEHGREGLASLTSHGRSRLMEFSRARFGSKPSQRGGGVLELGDAIASLFFGAVRDTFGYDAASVRVCPADDLIVMESFTTNSEYFRDAVWARIVQDSSIPVPRPSLTERLNDHVDDQQRDRGPEKRFSEWGDVFRNHFMGVANLYPETVKVYRRVGYFCP